jgi:phosphoenolpyruvate carboxykinase (GTP)
VPIDAFLFGGRRATTVPLVSEAFDWEHGVFLGATMSVETTAAAAGDVGKLRFDPFAMLPFCGYNMADYFAHWLKIGKVQGAKLPRIFMVNWFRKGTDGSFLWPGFGDNSRVLAYVLGRLNGEGEVTETPVGLVPTPGALPLEGLDLSEDTLRELLSVDAEQVRAQLPQIEEHLDRFGDRLPTEVRSQLQRLKARLG